MLNSLSRRQGREIPLLSRHCHDISFTSCRRERVLRFKLRHEVARSVLSRARSRDLFQVAPSRARTPFIAVPPLRSRTPLRRPPARPSSHRTVVRSASCAVEALKLHFNCAVVRSSFIAPSSAHASLRMASYLLSACHISPFDFVSSSVSMSACFSMSLSQNHLTHQ